jgi:hypothetical protein
MSKAYYFLFVFLLMSFFCADSYAQKKKQDNITDYFPTESSSWIDANTPKNAPKRKMISLIYKSDASGLLYGNPCAVDATKAMGFIYSLNLEGAPGSTPKFKRLANNILVNIKLIFTRSPFWKLILNKRINDCRERSGDFVG